MEPDPTDNQRRVQGPPGEEEAGQAGNFQGWKGTVNKRQHCNIMLQKRVEHLCQAAE